MDNKQSQLLGEIHATVKNLDKKVDDHLEDYGTHKRNFERLEKRQIALFAWMTGVGATVGAGASSVWTEIIGVFTKGG
jgi:hypothetical protein